ncbi:DUF2789 domain-containing protein [Acinetobacter portensis]|uniref:DUF2789 family protein n=3 Tax=Acinetobacter TaxID=469 RepID=A0AB35UX30_9GAMM|nr:MULTISPECIES: DUF2789 family protein [Acinetobacter]MBP7793587.1 DUF2789 domain-containing protein [Acinetobacter sp.]MCK7608525.1 DUF2789 domain-containing protein [Acinetobacter portensis]MCK7639339.1 DUF2789 domain-containing protein [Acinetobacter portensis]MDY6450037.1 DUF2789 family protein [Acinetobacter faecalis]MDY6456466.1 DUF2789 family protein [Acinetobacter faecalis]
MTVQPRMTNLFEQLGLDSSEDAIALFIVTHQLNAQTKITEADYWTESQRQFLAEKIKSDGSWALVVDQLNESLHEDSLIKSK